MSYKDKAENSCITWVKLFILIMAIVWISPFMLPAIPVGILMFFSMEYWSFTAAVFGFWFLLGIVFWLRGRGKKGAGE